MNKDFQVHIKSLRSQNIDPTILEKLVKRTLSSDLESNPNIEDIASFFFVSSRTFSRRLQQAGLNYRDILVSVKREAAIEYLGDPTLKISEIALKIGYCDKSNFTKAFKSWTGCTPGQFRSKNYRKYNYKKPTVINRLDFDPGISVANC